MLFDADRCDNMHLSQSGLDHTVSFKALLHEAIKQCGLDRARVLMNEFSMNKSR